MTTMGEIETELATCADYGHVMTVRIKNDGTKALMGRSHCPECGSTDFDVIGVDGNIPPE